MTESEPIVLDSDTYSDGGDCRAITQVEGSPLKVISSRKYRGLIEELDVAEGNTHKSSDESIMSEKLFSESMVKKKPKLSCEPVYEFPPAKYSAEGIIRILLNPNLDQSKICTSRPTDVSVSSTFIVDISKLAHPDDVKNDNFGIWSHSGSHPQAFKVHSYAGDDYVQVEKCAVGATGRNVVYLRRLHSVHPSNKGFKCMIAFISDSENSPHHLCLVVYRVPPGYVPVVKTHGNSKVETPFHPTWPSTKRRIKEECLLHGPDSTVSLITAEHGGILMASAPGELPRDAKQVSNFKRKLFFQSKASGYPLGAAADNLFVVMQQAYSDDPSHKFVRAVNAAPEPAIVLATDPQLRDLARFCTSEFEFSVLTVDPTFCLGEFDVTLITFRHLFLQSKRFKQPPVLIGPACIHYKKSFSTYLFFASTIVGQCRELAGVRALGTDGEQALIDAFKHEFGFAQHMTCFNHVRRNVKDKLHQCNIPSQVSLDILDDIFGKKAGTVFIEGLVDSIDVDDFDAKAESLTEKWGSVDTTSTSDMEGFIQWFKTHKAPVVRSSMIRQVREECGLGSPPAPFTTNASETANYILKHKVNYQRNELPEFLKKLRELIHDQAVEVEKALISRGRFELRSQYHAFKVPESRWFAMTQPQRQQHLTRFAAASLSDISSDVTESSSSSISVGRDMSLCSALSVHIDTFAESVRVPRNCLDGIWSKAFELLRTENAIVAAPGFGLNAKCVLSYQGKKTHLVVPKKGGQFACDSDYPNFKALGICAHVVAVAKTCQKLPEFVEWFKKAKKLPNLTKFAEATMPKGRGRKGGSCPRKRKAPETIATRITNPIFMQSEDHSSSEQDVGVSSSQDLPNLVSVAQSGSNPQSIVKFSNDSIM